MPDDPSALNADWAKSFARQALCDLHAYEILKQGGAEKCHRLHYLQMATEKACKAHMAGNGQTVVFRHDRIAKDLPTLARHFYGLSDMPRGELRRRFNRIKRYAPEIELLSSACNGDAKERQDNTEYPWQTTDGSVRSPCEYDFPAIDDNGREIVQVVKLIRKAAESYSQ